MSETYIYEKDDSLTIQKYINDIFKWMILGISITFISAFIIEHSGIMISGSGMILAIIAMILEFVVAIRLSRKLMKLSNLKVKLLYIAYSILTGITFSIVISCYTTYTVTLAFLLSAIYFGALVIVGTVIKKDLTKIGTICFTGLFVYIIFSIICLIFNLGFNSLLLPLISLVLFAGITAYDMQKALQLYHSVENNYEMARKIAIYSAFTLYLDFVNIFLDILRLLGNSEK